MGVGILHVKKVVKLRACVSMKPPILEPVCKQVHVRTCGTYCLPRIYVSLSRARIPFPAVVTVVFIL